MIMIVEIIGTIATIPGIKLSKICKVGLKCVQYIRRPPNKNKAL